jgi:hypothetical protein
MKKEIRDLDFWDSMEDGSLGEFKESLPQN